MLWAFLILFVSAPLLRADDRADARAHADKAQALLDQGGDASKARSEAFQATGLDDESAKAWWVLGLAEKALGHKDKARKAVERALELDPRGTVLDRDKAQALLDGLPGAEGSAGRRADSTRVMADFAQYVAERDREDRVVGQGSAVLAEQGGERARAERAARHSARAALAEAMHVRITVISEASESNDGSGDKMSSATRELSQTGLEDLEERVFTDFPVPGRVTVLTWMERERYLRLLEQEKVLRRGSEWGAAPRFGVLMLNCFAPGAQQGWVMRWGGDVFYGPWVVGGFEVNGPFVGTGGSYNGTPPGILHSQGHLNGWGVEGGWDWMPALIWHRFQPYAPLRLQYLSLSVVDLNGGSTGIPPAIAFYGARAGLGLRWWGSDIFSLDFRATYGMGLSQVSLQDTAGDPYYLNGSAVGPISDSGPEISVALRVGWL
jgi:hypothetical protein